MSVLLPSSLGASRVRARSNRLRAARLRERAEAERRRASELSARLAQNFVLPEGRPLGDRGESFLLRLGRLPALVRLVRHDLRRWLERAGVAPEVVDDVVLACSEACANAVEHARDASRQLVEVEARIDGARLEVCVRDFGSWRTHPSSELRGRGLELTRALVDSLDVDTGVGGTRVVMRRSL